jgi:Phage portal protein.
MIPRGLLKGDTADIDGMTDNFISFCINPIAEQIEDEINRKMFGKNNVIKHTYCKIRTDKIRNYDLTKIANSAELISRIGVWSINDILDFMDYEPIDEDWADKHVISKNYSLVEDQDNDILKGGENDNGDGEHEENKNSI